MQVTPFETFSWSPAQTHYPTKPFGKPYALVLIDLSQGKGICADTPDALMELWHPGYQAAENPSEILLILASSVASQMQAQALEQADTASLLPKHKEMIVSAVAGDDVNTEDWDANLPLYAVGEISEPPGDRVYAVDTTSPLHFIRSLVDMGLVRLLYGEGVLGMGSSSLRGSQETRMLSR